MLTALPPVSSPSTEPARLREQYRAGKNALLTSLAGSGASIRTLRGIGYLLEPEA